MKQLPGDYRAAAQALERYLMYFGAISRGDVLVSMNEDLVTMFEEAAAVATPLRDLLGDDPVEFAETFLANYADGQWIATERARLTETIARLARGGDRP